MTIHLPKHRWVWNRLGLAPTADRREIRKAYAARLKAIDTDADPQAFIALREAWEAAQRLAAEAAGAQAYAEQIPQDTTDPAPAPAETGPVEAAAAPSPADVAVRAAEPEEAPAAAAPATVTITDLPPGAPAEPAAATDPAPEVVVTVLPPAPAAPLPSDPPPEVIVRPAPEAPPAAEPAAADYPEAALFARIEALLAGGPRPNEAERLRAATEALLAHPSLDRIRVAASVEDWLAEFIEDFHPRSDPALEAAGAHFGWAARQDDWKAPHFIRWAARRLNDLAFERRLVAARPRFAEVLALLRSDAVPPPAEQVRRIAPDVHDFADYARLHHPSSVEACSRAMLDWWNGYFEAQPAWQREWDSLRRMARGRTGIWSVEPAPRLWPGGWLWIGLLVAPFLFAWVLLKRGYPPALRFAGFAWLSVMVFLFLAWTPPPPEPGAAGPPPIAVSTPSYASALDDLEPVLDAALGSEGSYFGLNIRNKPLFDRLLARWEQARAADEDKQAFAAAIGQMIEQAFRDGIAAGDAALQRDYWRFHADRLQWLRGGADGAEACRAWLDGERRPVELPPALEARGRALVEQAVMSAPATPRPAAGTLDAFDIPPGLAETARQRLALDRRRFDRAARGRGSAELRCGARIAIIEAALALPPAERDAFLAEISSRL
ncbi:J domain-containing protein [Sphingosinicella terrae]|uniref:J domain-containing protein n=1 Tax=Sphingosinicella terrae TaxID=2172047 RepID=UPI000E0D930A|nr:J domain-containing protein [Sphingosinicella terrae]